MERLVFNPTNTFFFFFGVPSMFLAFFIPMIEQSLAFNSNVETILVARCFWACNSIDYFMLTCLFSYIVVLDTFCLYMIYVCLVACLPLA